MFKIELDFSCELIILKLKNKENNDYFMIITEK